MESVVMPTLAFCALAYFVCGIPFGMLIARARGVDVRKTGSGNIGATNVGRSVGAWAAVLTFLLDAGKGWLCTGLASWLIPMLSGVELKAFSPGSPFDVCFTCVYAACVLGHVFSPYLKFHGGKGISVGFGAALGFDPRISFGLLAVFLVFVLPTRYVSLGSICAAASLSLWTLFFGYTVRAIIPMVIVAVCVIWAHRSNLKKLASHQEKKFSFHHSDGDGSSSKGGDAK